MSGSTTTLGIIDILWGGQKFNVETKTSKFSAGGLISTTVVYGRKVGQSQSFVASMVEASFPLEKEMSLATLRTYNGTEMQVKCDSGQTYTIPDATLQGDPSVKGGAGSNVSCKWGGSPASEALS